MRHARRCSRFTSLLVLIAGLGAAAATAPASADVVTERIRYASEGDTYFGWLVHDDALPTPRPAIILFHEWWGLEDFALEQARALAEAGYVVFCADMYGMTESGENVVAVTAEEASRLSGALYRDRGWMRQLATSAYLATARQPQVDPSRIATVGFGFGGTVGLELARSGVRLRGTVCFHGGLHNPSPADAESISGETLVIQGTADPMVSDAELAAFEQEMEAARKPYQILLISGAEHAFSNSRSDFWNIPGASFDQRAASIANDHVLAFLARTLGGATPGKPRQNDA